MVILLTFDKQATFGVYSLYRTALLPYIHVMIITANRITNVIGVLLIFIDLLVFNADFSTILALS